jgi:hypothetical protein
MSKFLVAFILSAVFVALIEAARKPPPCEGFGCPEKLDEGSVELF